MNNVVCVKGISGYVDDSGTVWLNAENVARGLGFTKVEEKISPTNGRKKYETVRWSRINSYLAEYNYPPVKADDFIPENMFYRLAMKANNSAAQKFQALIADEILPAIRKQGVYMTAQAAEKIISNPDFIIKLAQQVKQAQIERDQFKALAAAKEEQIQNMQPVVSYCESILQSKEALPMRIIADDYGLSSQKMHQLLQEMGLVYRAGKTWLLKTPYKRQGFTDKTTTLLPDGRSVTNNYWTPKGRNFLYHVLKKRGILPLSEQEREACLFDEEVNN